MSLADFLVIVLALVDGTMLGVDHVDFTLHIRETCLFHVTDARMTECVTRASNLGDDDCGGVQS